MARFQNLSHDMNEEISELSKKAKSSTIIDSSWYQKFDVKRGLRDANGKGVVCGLTEISEINKYSIDEKGNYLNNDGQLFYRGYPIKDLVNGCGNEKGFGFEEIAYLLLFGELPSKEKYAKFMDIITELCSLPTSFVRDIIMKAPSNNMMNLLARGVLALYSYDDKADLISVKNVVRQILQLTAQMPLLGVYSYKVHRYYNENTSLIIHRPKDEYCIAQNILHLLRDDHEFSTLEAKILDLCLILHAEHGGGNNSTFTTHVVSSSGTDTYSTIAASLGSLKGPRHGGANIKVVQMMDDLKASIRTPNDKEIEDYLAKLLDKKVFDKAGLIYGIGHAIYADSDPRAEIIKGFVEKLAVEKGREEELQIYKTVERVAPGVVASKKNVLKGVSANVDFFSGFVYTMLDIPRELFTPLFAISRITGWGAHRIEELSNEGKIIRPAYESVAPRKNFVSMENR